MPENSDSVGRTFESCRAYHKCSNYLLLLRSATGQSFLGDSLDFQTTLHNLAGGFLVLIERVGVDIQRGRWLAVS